ncbi:arylsulfatase [Rhabdothermincola sp.]|uniref:arylsulfatase n=1 Tax=Rhabdothermincola sp. TaxID=2820405 RepID=UPI002FDF2BB5
MNEQSCGVEHDELAPYAGHQGRVGRTFAGSEGWWPPRPSPPEGAPNVIVMLVDDLGYADIGPYGSEIDTPHLNALADRGLRYTNFHSAPMCSPTRAALLTGLNPHDAGVGTVPHADPGFPGYAMELTEHAATMAEILRDHGYATMALGKWHLTLDALQNAAGDKRSWPCQRGFDRYYGVLDAFTNLHHPHRIVEDNHQVDIDRYPDGYFFTDDLTDRAISMIREVKAANPRTPFFCYFAHAAVHAPLHAKPTDIEKYRGAYEAGWDVLREQRYRRQLELGILEPGTELAPRNAEPDNDVRPWDELSEEERKLFARYMEVYAAAVDNIDQNLGRLLAELDALGELDNTIVIFTSDNGASREGEAVGTTAYYVHLLQGDDLAADLERFDLIGGPRTTPHYPRGWAMLGNTPFRLYKLNTHAGGHSVPFIISWPRLLAEQAGQLRRQYTHVTDVLPTLLELIGIERPEERNGKRLKPLAGTSFVPTLRDPQAPSRHVEQHYETFGHRGFYREGWEVVTLHRPLTPFDDAEWELYHLETDPTELNDLASEHPDRVRELAEAFDRAAWRFQVYPLDEGSSVKYLVRPPWVDAFAEPVTIRPGTPTLERWRSVQLIWFRSCRITARLGGFRPGDRGYLVAHGDQGSGYGLYVLDDEAVFVHNDGRGRLRRLSAGEVPAGAREIVVDLHAPGRTRWDVTVRVDGRVCATLEGVPMLFGMAPFEGIDVGIDRRSPVAWDLYERFGPFPFTGALDSVRYEPGDPAPDSPQRMIDVLREMGARFE